MANDNDKTKSHGSILNREPNTLDKIGSKEHSRSYMHDVALMERRAAIETVEMRRLQQSMQAIDDLRTENARRNALAVAGMLNPTEVMFRRAGVKAETAQELVTKLAGAPNELRGAFSRSVYSFDEKLAGRRSEYEQQFGKLKELAQVNAVRMFAGRAISAAESESGFKTLRNDPNVLAASERYASSATDVELRKGFERAQSSRRRAGIELEETAQFSGTPEGKQKYLSMAERFEKSKAKEAALYGALNIQSKAGIDVSGIQKTGASIAMEIQEEKKRRELSEAISKGGTGSLKAETEELRSKESEFLKTLSNFNRAIEESGDASKTLRDEFKQAAEAYDDQRKKVDEIQRQGGGGGRFNNVMMGAQVARAALGVASYAAVGSEMEQMNLRIGAAQFANQRYTDQLAATQGDMAALRRVASRQQDMAAAYGATYGNRALAAAGAGMAIDAVSAGAKGAVIYGTGGAASRFLGGSMAGDAASAVNAAVRMGSGITYAEQQQASAAQMQMLSNTVNEIPDAARQAFYNYRMGAFQNLRGAGSSMSAMYGAATSAYNREQLANLGIAPEQQTALFGVGARAIGRSFLKNEASAMGAMTYAGRLQSLGYMGADEALGRMGQMTQAGGNIKDFQDIMAAAVATGVDDAKSMSGMFESIQILARDSASRGVGVAPVVAAQMAFGMQQLKGVDIDPALKQSMLTAGIGRVNAVTGATGVDYRTMLEMSMLGSLKGSTSVGRAGVAGANITDIMALARRAEELRAKGGGVLSEADISAFGPAAAAFVGPGGRLRSREEINKVVLDKYTAKIGGSVAGLSSIAQKAISDIREGKSISPEATVELEAIGFSATALRSIIKSDYSGIDKGQLKDMTGGAESARRSMAAGASSLSKQLSQIGKMGGTENQLAESIATLQESIMANADIDDATKASYTAASTMTLSTNNFKRSVDTFAEAVSIFVGKAAPSIGKSPEGSARPTRNSQSDPLPAPKEVGFEMTGDWLGNKY